MIPGTWRRRFGAGALLFGVVAALGFSGALRGGAAPPALRGRVVFLGDSITYGGQYVEFVEAGLRLRPRAEEIEVLNLGLPSETVSGLSEPGHAGGAFPRPDLRERLDRVLAKTKPDVVVACYGMNDGIYFPFDEARFQAFQAGVRTLHTNTVARGIRMIHVTPPVFDPLPLAGRTLPAGRAEYPQPFAGYNDVLDRYADWLLAQRTAGWEVVDAHGPINRFLAARRQQVPQFHVAADGIHPDRTGHWLIARELLAYLGLPAEVVSADSEAPMIEAHPHGPEVLQLVQQRQRLLKDAWLTETGHRRPGMAPGLPLAQAQDQARELGVRLGRLLATRSTSLPGSSSRRE